MGYVSARHQKKDHSKTGEAMKIGDIKRIKTDQEYTIKSARGRLCVVEKILENGFLVRIEDIDGTHFTQFVKEKHLM